MAGSINKTILVGNLGRDPEIRQSQDGTKIATFSIATSDSWRDKATGERRDNTQWHRVVVFNDNLSEIVEKYVKKGTKIYIEGALQHRKYTGQDNIEKSITEIVISRFKGELQILDSRKDSGLEDTYSNSSNSKAKPSSDNKSGESYVEEDELDDDIPF